MRRPRKRWLLTLKITLAGVLLGTLIGTAIEWSFPADAVIQTHTGLQPRPFNYQTVSGSAVTGLYFGLLIGLVVNAVAMIIEEPRPHW
jgi:hypothetical protein